LEQISDRDEIPYDLLDRDARRRRLAEESRLQDYRHRSSVYQEIEKADRAYKRRTRLGILAVLLSLLAGAMLYAHNYRMTTYSVDSESTLKGLKDTALTAFQDGVILCGRDSVSYLKNGEILWSEELPFVDGTLVTCGDYFCVYKPGGNDLLTLDTTGLLCRITLGRVIRSADLSGSGVAAVVTESGDATYITYYDRFGSRISVEVKTLISQSGFPMDISVSPNGQCLAAAYYTLNGGLGESRLILYDFEKGHEANSYVVGTLETFKDTDSLLLEVSFLNDSTLALVSDNRLTLVRVPDKNQGEWETILSEPLSEDTLAVFRAGSEMALAESYGKNTVLKLFSTDGSVETVTGEIGYEQILVGERQVLFREGERIVFMNRNGTLRYDGELTETPVDMAFTDTRSLLLSTGTQLRKITLK